VSHLLPCAVSLYNHIDLPTTAHWQHSANSYQLMKLNSIEKLIKQQFNKDNDTISLLFHIKLSIY